VADGECDEACSALVRLGTFDAALSPDWDLVLFGCPIVVRWVPDPASLVTIVRLDDVLHGLRMTREEMCLVFALSGVDYNGGGGLLSVEESRRLVTRYKDEKSPEEICALSGMSENEIKWKRCKRVFRL
jgi:hypothetical protein